MSSSDPLLAATSFAASDQQRAALQSLLEEAIAPLTIAGHSVDAASLRRLYRPHGYDLLWANREDRVATLASAFDSAADDGLDALAPLPDPRKVKATDPVERDLLLSDGALRFAAALAVGRVRPEQWEEDWAIAAPGFDAVAGLDRALSDNRLGPWLAGLAPSDLRYVRLKSALALYRDLARRGAWPQVASGPTIKPGMIDDRVGAIRKRLVAEGYLPSDTAPRTVELPADIADDSAGIVVVSSAEIFDPTIEQGGPRLPEAPRHRRGWRRRRAHAGGAQRLAARARRADRADP